MEYRRIVKKAYLEGLVSSETEKDVIYKVIFDKNGWSCECKSNKIRKELCKHILFAIKTEKEITK